MRTPIYTKQQLRREFLRVWRDEFKTIYDLMVEKWARESERDEQELRDEIDAMISGDIEI